MHHTFRIASQKILAVSGFVTVYILVGMPGVGFAQHFTLLESPATLESQDKSFGCGFRDVDNDGDLDVFISSMQSPNVLFTQSDSSELERSPEAPTGGSSASFGCSWGDYDGDGLDDLFVPVFGGPGELYHNDGDALFSRVTDSIVSSTPGAAQGSAWFDFEGDGDLDLLVVTRQESNRVFINDGGEFLTAPPGPLSDAGHDGHGVAIGDYDNDGDLDVFIAGNTEGPNSLFRNDGGGDYTALLGGPMAGDAAVSIGASWGDVDNDGDLDLFVANALESNNFMYLNNGNGSFSSVVDGPHVDATGAAMGSCFGDMDNDGDLDLFVSRSDNQPNTLYLNDGSGLFTLATDSGLTDAARSSRGCSWGDMDNDGDLDLFVTNAFGDDDTNELYQNDLESGHWIGFDLDGDPESGSSYGVRINMTATINGREVTQLREWTGQNGAYGSSTARLHFGLGDATAARSVTVTWPSGKSQTLASLAVDRRITLSEKEAAH
jgi:enediyne biosynthesis protein E4